MQEVTRAQGQVGYNFTANVISKKEQRIYLRVWAVRWFLTRKRGVGRAGRLRECAGGTRRTREEVQLARRCEKAH